MSTANAISISFKIQAVIKYKIIFANLVLYKIIINYNFVSEMDFHFKSHKSNNGNSKYFKIYTIKYFLVHTNYC